MIDSARIQTRITELAIELNSDLKGKNPLFLAILNGAFIFAADLMKGISIDCEISFVKLASYKGTKSSGSVLTLIGLDEDVNDRNIIIIEDIVDTGNTMTELLPKFNVFSPRSIKIATMFFKPAALVNPIKPDYVGFEIGNEFIVGYGLDYEGLGRNLNDVFVAI